MFGNRRELAMAHSARVGGPNPSPNITEKTRISTKSTLKEGFFAGKCLGSNQ